LLLSIWEKYQSTMLLVTHDVDEALYLCDRIIILRGQPGEIHHILKTEQKRPRARGDADLGRLKEKIINLLDLSHNKVQPTS
jgi:sulfonate transport system ATP-binding protein